MGIFEVSTMPALLAIDTNRDLHSIFRRVLLIDESRGLMIAHTMTVPGQASVKELLKE